MVRAFVSFHNNKSRCRRCVCNAMMTTMKLKRARTTAFLRREKKASSKRLSSDDEKEERAAALSVVRAVPFKSIGKVATLVVLGLIISRAIDVHVHGRV